MFSHLGRGLDDNTGQGHEAGAGTPCRCLLLLLLLALLPEPANRTPGEIDPDALDLRVQVERVPAHLAAVA